jgi:hypothetical protein
MDTRENVIYNAPPATTSENIFLLTPNLVGEFTCIQHSGDLLMLTY